MDLGIITSFFLSNPQILLEGLTSTLIKASIILILAFGITSAMKKASASARHFVWVAALIAVTLLPVLPALLPQWDSPFQLGKDSSNASQHSEHITASAPKTLEAKRYDSKSNNGNNVASSSYSPGMGQSGTALAQEKSQDDLKISSTEITPLSTGIANQPEANNPVLLLIFLWTVGTVSTLIWLVTGIISVNRSLSKSSRITSGPWQKDLEILKRQYDLSEDIQLVFSQEFDYPLVFGFIKPKLVIPAKDLNKDSDFRNIVLLHELAHIKRKDTFTQLFVHFALPLNWFNPLAWLAVKTLVKEQELSCDDYVLNAQISPADYATQLLQITETMKGRATWAAASMARKSELKGRIMSILNPERNRRTTGKLFAFVLAVITVFIALPLASAQVWTNSSEELTNISNQRLSPTPYNEKTQDKTEDDIKEVRKKLEDLNKAQLLKELNSNDPYISSQAAFYLGVFKEKASEAIPRLLEILGDDRDIRINYVYEYPGKKNSVMWWRGGATPGNIAVGALKSIGFKDISKLTHILNNGNEHARYNALRILGKLESSDALGAIAKAVDDTNPDSRQLAIKYLAKSEDIKYLDVIGSRIQDENKEVRYAAVKAMKNYRDEACIPYLVKTVSDTEYENRYNALKALESIGSEKACAAAIPFLKDRNVEIRYKALRVLRESKNPAALEAMKPALSDKNEEIRLKSLKYLMETEDSSLIPALRQMKNDPSKEVRYYAVKALRRIDAPEAASALAAFLQDENGDIRNATIRALKDKKDSSTLPALKECLSREHDPDLIKLLDRTIRSLEK